MKSAPPRAASRSTSAAAERLRLMPPAAAIGFGLIVAGALALVFPYRSLEDQIARDARRVDALQIAYLQAWLDVRPDRHQLRYLFARQLTDTGELALARKQVAALQATRDPRLRPRVLLLDIDIEVAEIQQVPEGSDEKRAQLSALRARLNRMAADDGGPELSGDTEAELASRAVAVGADVAALLWYERLLDRRARLPASAWEEAARRVLALGEAELASRMYFAALDASRRSADQRRNFLAGLRVLQGAGLFALALQMAEQNLGPLTDDAEVLEFLTRLALAANRPDVAQRYATRLLKISLLPYVVGTLAAQGRTVPQEWQRTLAHLPARVHYAQATSTQSVPPDYSRTPHLPFNDRLYTLSYDVFVANNNLRDALIVAQAAVRQVPGNRVWRLRLAQVADWSGQPALALEQWHALARASQAPADWAEVQRRAPQVFDNARWLDALQFAQRRKPNDFELIRALVTAYEQQGEPERAIALLQAPGAAATRRQRLELLAQVAERAGRDELRRNTLRTIAREFKGDLAGAMALAQLEYARGDTAAAFATLAARLATAAPPSAATPEGHDFWSTYADLAAIAGRKDEAVRAYRLVIASGRADEDDYANLSSALEDSEPLESAEIAERAFVRFGKTHFASQALYLLTRHGSPAQTRALLDRLAARGDALERDASFLAQRASSFLANGDSRAAARDAQRALQLRPENPDLRAVLIWAQIAGRAAPELRAHLNETAAAALSEPALWGPMAAGWLSLQEPQRALPWLKLRTDTARADDVLWLLSFADALGQLGRTDAAWQLRRRAWLRLHEAAIPPVDREQQRDRERRLLSLALTFETGGAARARMKSQLAADSRSPGGREAMLAYWISRESSELAKAWLVGRVLRLHPRAGLSAPPWAELSVALAENDQARLADLLDTAADWLPLADRTEAALRIGRDAASQTYAFDAATRAPENDLLHERLSERLLASPEHLGGGIIRFKQKPLRETGVLFEAATRLSPRWMLGVRSEHLTRDSIDAEQLVATLPDDHINTLSARYAPERDAVFALSIQQRDSLTSTVGALIEAQRQVAPRLRLGASVGIAQPATDTVVARIGAVRDFVQADTSIRLSQREFVRLDFTANRFYAQGGGGFGSGTALRIDVRHRVRFEYPDLSLRAGFADLRYSPDAGLEGAMLPLLPPALRAGATNAIWLPASTHQLSLGFDCGESARFSPTRAWRPFCSFGLTEDSRNGTQTDWLLGTRGSVFGADDLSLSVSGGGALGAQRIPFTLWSARYRYFF